VDVNVQLDVFEQEINMIVKVDGHVQMDHFVIIVREKELTAAAMMNSVPTVKEVQEQKWVPTVKEVQEQKWVPTVKEVRSC
jgi:hypothetical protein